MSALHRDYLERVYAGVLGKLIGVYLGRPFEMWSPSRILSELGPIKYYVNDKFNIPLVIVDDDISGTFTFICALEEHASSGADLTSEEVGRTWLNNVIEKRSVFWWGGNGISTEHTAYRNLKSGVAAPGSGSMERNGRTVSEQIGAQIFIDGWGMVAPGQPELAARLAESAARVSHDGEAVEAAKLWAAMEAEAFVERDVQRLLDVGLGVVKEVCLVKKLVADVREWARRDEDWMVTRQRIDDEYYKSENFPGVCHVIPNHGIMIMALIYGGESFHEAMHIINTCGWDTDCNSGNVGCLLAIMHGLKGFEGGPDWRGPIADRAIISSADGGYSINNAARLAFDIADTGRRLAWEKLLPAPKDGAQFHFSLPGSVQGFQAVVNPKHPDRVKVQQDIRSPSGSALAIELDGLHADGGPVEILTDTFISQDVLEHKRDYEIMACPLLYPGQQVTAVLQTDSSITASVHARIRLKAYNPTDDLITVDSHSVTLAHDTHTTLTWEVPNTLDNHPIQQLGIALSTDKPQLNGTVWLDSLKIHGTPRTTLRRPKTGPDGISGEVNMWHRSWVNSVDVFHTWGPSFFIAHDHGEGMISHGTRDWADYNVVASKFSVNLGAPAGVAVRVRGLNRWYALMFVKSGRVALVKARDEQRIELACEEFDWRLDEKYEVSLMVHGTTITGEVGGVELKAEDTEFQSGGIGLVVTNGSLSVERMEVGRVDRA